METEIASQVFLTIFSALPILATLSFDIIGAIVFVILLLYSSAMISGSEVAFFSLTHNDFAKLEEENALNSKRILELKEMPRTLLATILISNNFINIAITLISTLIITHFFPDEVFAGWGEAFFQSNFFSGFKSLLANLGLEPSWTGGSFATFFEFLIVTLSVTFFLVLFGEVAPKIYAKLNNVLLAKIMSGPLWVLIKIFMPMSQMLVKGTNLIESRLEKTRTSGNLTSKEEIGEAIELTVSQDEDAQGEVDILKSILKFGDVNVTQIMRSRVDVVAVDFKSTYHEVLNVVRESGYSRIPIFEEDFDHVTGILYAKDLLGHLEEPDEFEWQPLIHTNIYYVPETKKIDALLKELQEQRQHMAIVVDEYGGTSGIVTLEDVMEEVIGEIHDEFDTEREVDFQKIDDFNYIFEGKTMLNDVCRIIGVDTETFDKVRGESDSMAGLLLEMIGIIPKKGREITFEDFRFKVESVSKRRIEKILITLPKEK